MNPNPVEAFLRDFDLQALSRECNALTALKSCSQDLEHHGEGNVFVHTQLVLDALRGLSTFCDADTECRSILALAAVFHDVAKPLCTRLEAGRLTTRGHGRRGAVLARSQLWKWNVPFSVRERVCCLVRYHELPFFAIDRTDGIKRMYRASQTVRCDHLAALARADGLGRLSSTQQRMLDNVDCFEQLARDHDCAGTARSFPSPHARFEYFRSADRNPFWDAWDRHQCEVTIMSGLPGAGKDTWVKKNLPNVEVISLDQIRRSRGISPTDPQGHVVWEARERARVLLRNGQNFVWNATNLSSDMRQQVISLAADYGAWIRIVYVEVPESRLRQQNVARESAIPDQAVDEMLERWEVPECVEADELVIAHS